MDWLINLLGQLVLAYFLGAFILAGWQTLKEAAEEHKKEQEEDDELTKVHIRTYNGTFYAYDAESNDFLGQGVTLEEMTLNIHINTKETKVIFVSSDEESYESMVAFLKEKLQKETINAVPADSPRG